MRKTKEVGVGHEADQKEDVEQVKSLRFKCNPVCLSLSVSLFLCVVLSQDVEEKVKSQ